MDLDRIYCGDSEILLKQVDTDSIDLTVTSPPYDDLRTYGKDPNQPYSFPFEAIASELIRVTKPGGVIVWVVGAQVIGGSETLTPFKQAMYYVEHGLRLHDTMIYEKNSSAFPARRNANRYTQVFEYMFVFSKGEPKTAILIADKKNRWVGWKGFGKTRQRDREGNLIEYEKKDGTPEESPRNNVWRYTNEFENDEPIYDEIWRFATGKGYTSTYSDSKEWVKNYITLYCPRLQMVYDK